MQELNIVSLASELSSETVKKGLRGATYDPLHETVFAVLQRDVGDRGSILIGVPDSSAKSEYHASS
jgi:hypothetical protein